MAGENVDRKKSLLDVFKNLMENTSAHGLPNIDRAPNAFRKCFWSLLFTWALGMFLWQSYELIYAYFQWEVEVNIDIQYKNELDFPAVTICNLNPVKLSSLRNNDKLNLLLGADDGTADVQVTASASSFTVSKLNTVEDNPVTSVVTKLTTYLDDLGQGTDPTSQSPAVNQGSIMGLTTEASRDSLTTDANLDVDLVVTTPISNDMNMTSTENDGSTLASTLASNTTPLTDGQPPTTVPVTTQTVPMAKPKRRKRGTETTESTSKKYQDWNNINYRTRDTKLDLFDQVTDTLAAIGYNERRGFGHSIDDMLLSCTYKGYPCGPMNFTHFHNYLHGNCYTFNSGMDGDIQTSSKSGPLYGLVLELNLEESEYIPAVQEAAGVRVVIGEQQRMTFPEDSGVNIAPGILTSIGLRKVEIQREPFPYGNCTEQDSEQASSNVFTSFFGVNYSLEVCQKDCLYNEILEMCGCADTRFSFLSGNMPCLSTNHTQVICKEIVERLYTEDEIQCNCTSPCHESSFDLTVSSAAWPNTLYEDSVRQDLLDISDVFRSKVANDPDFVQNNVLKLQVYYEQLNYEKISQTAKYNEFGLISNLGGQVGLWIGISMCTVFEFIELMYDVCKILCYKLMSCGHANRATAPSAVELEIKVTPANHGSTIDY